MATKKPLVLGANGLPQQLQAGDNISVTAAQASIYQQTNGEVAAVVIGAPVYQFAAGSFKKALANAAGTSDVLGLVADSPSITNGAIGGVCVQGILTATTVQWDAVTGGTGGLVFNTKYFLDPTTSGKLTSTPPTTVGQLVVLIGTAISTVDMEVAIQSEILL